MGYTGRALPTSIVLALKIRYVLLLNDLKTLEYKYILFKHNMNQYAQYATIPLHLRCLRVQILHVRVLGRLNLTGHVTQSLCIFGLQNSHHTDHQQHNVGKCLQQRYTAEILNVTYHTLTNCLAYINQVQTSSNLVQEVQQIFQKFEL